MAVTWDRSVVFPGFLHQWNWPPRYSCNIFESGVKHHNSLNLNRESRGEYCPWIVFIQNDCTFFMIITGHQMFISLFYCGLLMNVFLLSTRFVNSTGMYTGHLHWFLATLLVGNLTRVQRTFKNLVLAPLQTVRGTKWGIFIEDIP